MPQVPAVVGGSGLTAGSNVAGPLNCYRATARAWRWPARSPWLLMILVLKNEGQVPRWMRWLSH